MPCVIWPVRTTRIGWAELKVMAEEEVFVIVTVWLDVLFPLSPMDLTTGPRVTLTVGLLASLSKRLPSWARMVAFRSEPNWPHLAWGKVEPMSHSSAVLRTGPALQVICDPMLCNFW